ncbi:MAG TPA: hypothetical protein VKC34_14015 [Blastocatellia bacterium]|nr:hypothetical protein [Blastocatellia bacterium]
MIRESSLEQVRESALDRIDRSERWYKIAWAAGLMIEAVFLLSFVLLADFSNRNHLLLLIAAMAVYMILGAGLFALGAHVSRCTQRVLRAVENRD